jgi:hypothetical protein
VSGGRCRGRKASSIPVAPFTRPNHQEGKEAKTYFRSPDEDSRSDQGVSNVVCLTERDQKTERRRSYNEGDEP